MRFTISYTPVEKLALESGITGVHTTNVLKTIHLTPKARHDMRKMGTKSEGYVSLVMNGSIAHPEVIPPTFNLNTHTGDRDTRLYLIDKRDKLLAEAEGIDNSIMQLGNNMIGDADFMADLIINAAKHDQNLQTIVDGINDFRKKNPVPHAHIGVPMNGTVTEEGIKKGTRLTNWGTTILTLNKTGMTTGSMAVGPHDSVLIPDEWVSTTITNGSGTTAGEFSI